MPSPPQQDFPHEQARQATILFCLLTGINGLSEDLDIEDLNEVIDACFQQISTPILAQGGTIDKYMVDSLLATFGVPVAHEDDPTRAVRAALAMLRVVARFNETFLKRTSHRIGLRIGINTGKVFAGHLGHGDPHLTVLGDVVNIASRLQHAAPENSILIGESTRRALADRFVVAHQPPLVVKGKHVPLTVFRVYPGDCADIVSEPCDSGTDFVGRCREFGILARNWRAVLTAGSANRGAKGTPGGTWIALWGEAGMGKDRLLDEFLHHVVTEPVRPRALAVRGSAWSEGRGWQVLRGVVRSLAGGNRRRGADEEMEAINRIATRVDGKVVGPGVRLSKSVVVHALATLGGLPSHRVPRDGFRPDSTDLRRQGILALCAACESIARERPLLLVVRDAQWAEDAALDFIETLGRAVPANMMLVTSARPALQKRRPAWGREATGRKVVVLKPFSRAETWAFVRRVAKIDDSTLHRILDPLHHFTGGTPRFVAEVLRYYVDRGPRFTPSDSDWLLPESIEAVVQTRLDRLPFEEGVAIRAAAVVGTVFWAGAVDALVESDQSSVLNALIQRNLIHACATTRFAGEQEFRFDHVLVARVARSNLIDVVRERYHRRVASWLEDRVARDGCCDEEVGRHWKAGGKPLKAARFFVRAGDAALRRHDVTGAARLFNKVLDTLTGLDREDIDTQVLRAQALAKRGECRRRLWDHSGAVFDLEQAARQFEDLGVRREAAIAWYGAALAHVDRDALEAAWVARAAGNRCSSNVSDTVREAFANEVDGRLQMVRGEPGQAFAGLSRALSLFRRDGDQWSVGRTLESLAKVHRDRSELTPARFLLAEGIRRWERLKDWRGLARSLRALGEIEARTGRFAEALRDFDRSVRLFRRVGEKEEIGNVLLDLGAVCVKCGYLGMARKALLECLELSPADTHFRRAGWALLAMADIWLAAGDYRHAAVQADRAIEVWHDFGVRDDGPFVARLTWARGALLAGDIEGARAVLEDTKSYRDGLHGERGEAAWLLVSARVALAQNLLGQAQDLLNELRWSSCVAGLVECQIEADLLAGEILAAQRLKEEARKCYQEAEQAAARHDMVPLWWTILVSWKRINDSADTVRQETTTLLSSPTGKLEPGTLSSIKEVFREFATRIEDPELTQKLHQHIPDDVRLP